MDSTRPSKSQLRLRIFAGPNGSGKTTMIQAVRTHKVKEVPIDFGVYINSDDIAARLKNDTFRWARYKVVPELHEFMTVIESSGLLGKAIGNKELTAILQWDEKGLIIRDKKKSEIVAQMLAEFLRHKMLQDGKKFSFETVFSHASKIDLMKTASEMGYKVYLYFIATESPEINKYRVKKRVKEDGHDVDEDKIESRYYRSLDLLYEAAQHSYKTYFFDNSIDQSEPDSSHSYFAMFSMIKGKKKWEIPKRESVPLWFMNNYYDKAKKRSLQN